jgi:ABC-2 type transport system ATP-binding protein
MLRLEGVRKSYGDLVAVDALSLEARRGEVLGLLGPNGAGKSTTIHMAVGLLAPDAGSVDVGGLGPPTQPEVRRSIGVAPQAIALYEDLTADENLRVFGRVWGVAERDLPARVDRLLDWTGLASRRRDRVSEYSGGMRRRLNLAAAMVHDPPLLLLDEPTAGVDPQSRAAILDAVRGLRGEGKTIVYTTHYMEEAAKVCDRVAIVDHGRLLALDTVDALIGAHGGRSVVVVVTAEGEHRVETDDPIGELRTALGRAPLQVRVERPDLEGVFLRLTGRRLRD